MREEDSVESIEYDGVARAQAKTTTRIVMASRKGRGERAIYSKPSPGARSEK